MPIARILSGACGAFILGASSVAADVTAREVWQEWQSQLEGFGYTLSSNLTETEDSLSISDLGLSMNLPEQSGTTTISISQIDFRSLGDGTVAVMLPESTPVQISVRRRDGDNLDATMDYTQSGYNVIVSGEKNDLTYTYSIDTLGMALRELTVEGEPVELGDAEFTMRDLSGTSRMKTAAMRDSVHDLTVAQMNYVFDVIEPDSKGKLQWQGLVNSLTMKSSSTLPLDMNHEGMMGRMLQAGMAVDTTIAYADGQNQFSFTDAENKTDVSSNSSAGKLTLALNKDHLNYSGNASGINISTTSANLPFPMDFQLENAAFNLMAPLAKSETPADFALAVTFGGFKMSDMIWSLFDPEAKLPRDPSTIAFDLTGQVKPLFDIGDPVALEAMEKEQKLPVEIHSVRLVDLNISAVGATLKGEGAFTFDNTDTTTFKDMPAPVGEIDLTIMGANGLLDALIAMGLLPEQQASGMRMMMALFTTPAEGPDNLKSKIEVREGGQVFANGQRVK